MCVLQIAYCSCFYACKKLAWCINIMPVLCTSRQCTKEQIIIRIVDGIQPSIDWHLFGCCTLHFGNAVNFQTLNFSIVFSRNICDNSQVRIFADFGFGWFYKPIRLAFWNVFESRISSFLSIQMPFKRTQRTRLQSVYRMKLNSLRDSVIV